MFAYETNIDKNLVMKSPILGVDLGGTKTEVALVDTNGNVLYFHKYPTNPDKGLDGVVADIVSSVNRCLCKTEQEPKMMGIGVAGQVDFDGTVLHAPNLMWYNVPLKAMLEEKLGLQVVVTNDVRAATYGEWIYGSGIGVDDLIVLFVGTGIGGGVISGGRMIVGCRNVAGELGHTTIVANGRRCRCNNLGCLEAYAGGWAIAERAQLAVNENLKAGQRILSYAGSIQNITAATISQAYSEGDQLAHQLADETAQYLAAGVVSFINAFNPCLFVMGGGVIEGLPNLIQNVEIIVRKQALKAAINNLTFTKAKLGNKAGVVGATAIVQKRIDRAL